MGVIAQRKPKEADERASSDVYRSRQGKEGPDLMANTIASVVLGGFLVLLVYLYNLLVLKPKNLRAKLQRQGIRGPSPSFLVGNIPDMERILQHRRLTHSTPTTATEDYPTAISGDWPSIVFPYLEEWKNEYGTNLSPFPFSSFV